MGYPPRFATVHPLEEKPMHEQAHAKINLLLSVRPGPDERGYHAVTTVMCPLVLCDDVEVCACAEPGVALTCEPDPLPTGSDPAANVAYRAAVAMGECFERPLALRIAIQKRIPSQAGLGGGSSDAAAVIRALVRLWGIDSADDRLLDVAASLGADVPFFLHETPTLLERYGDVAQEHFEPFARPVVLVKPAGGVSTAEAYRRLDALAPDPVEPMALCDALRCGNVDEALGLLANTMEGAARSLQPAVNEVFSFLASCKPTGGPLLCGSGSCVAAFMGTSAEAVQVAAKAQERGWWACATQTLA